MRTKIVYVLVSSEDDYYYEMFLLSYNSLRLHHENSNIEVVLVMDHETHQRLVNDKSAILDEIVPVVVVIPSFYSVLQRSRFLKTSLRRLVEGDFLYLDIDTIICEPLDAIDYTDAEIAMVSHRNSRVELSDSYSIKLCKRAGYDKLRGKPYYNAGVAYVKDTSLCHRFFELWHESWINQKLNKCSQDQPALCKANAELGFPIKELSGIWNCQLKYADSASFIDKAKVLHYFSQNSLFTFLLFNFIRESGIFPETIRSMIADGSKTIGYVLYMNDARTRSLVISGLPYSFESNQPFYRIIAPIAHLTKIPVRFVSGIKKSLKAYHNA